jgi:hypothetical protein
MTLDTLSNMAYQDALGSPRPTSGAVKTNGWLRIPQFNTLKEVL